MNNLYGLAMNEYLPYGGLEWLENIDKFDIMSVNEKSPIEYVLEVDLKYPEELHKLHNDFPLTRNSKKNLLFTVICCQNIVKKLVINMK